eukprot:10676946-Heterocapsa_arctica.AAC.1
MDMLVGSKMNMSSAAVLARAVANGKIKMGSGCEHLQNDMGYDWLIHGVMTVRALLGPTEME